jgi:NAD(P)H-dependent flavin oxidoreductase YrpB (nitropropane dioxygenase family)
MALNLGAQAAWLGTRFLLATEASSHEAYRHELLRAGVSDTVYTDCFDGGWPHAPHRVLRNETLSRWEAAGRPEAPHRPGEGDLVATDTHERSFHRYDDMMPLRQLQGDVREMALYAGQSVGLVQDVMSAGEIVRTLAEGADAALSGCID